MQRHQRRVATIHLNQPMCYTHRNGLVTVEYAQFADDVAEMKVHRALGDVQLVADVGTHHAARREMEALELARGKGAAFLHGRNPLLNDRLHKYEVEN